MLSYELFFAFLETHGFQIERFAATGDYSTSILANGPYGPVAELNHHNELTLMEYDLSGELCKMTVQLDEPNYQYVDYCDKGVCYKREYVTDGKVVTIVTFSPEGTSIEEIK